MTDVMMEHPNAPDAKSIEAGLKPAATPMDFIRANLRTAAQPAEATPVPSPTMPPEPVAQEPVKQAIQSIAPQSEFPMPDPVPSEPKQESVAPEAPRNAAEELLKKGPTKDESFKALRTKVKTYEENLAAKEAEVAALAEEVEKFRKGENVPEAIVNLTNQVASLTGYQKLHAFKTSEEYQQKFVEPLIGLQSKLEKLGTDYALPKEVLEKASGLSNKKDLNAYLGHYFDPVGAAEARGIIDEMRGIKTQAAELEKDPENSHRVVREEYLTRQRVEDEARVTRLASNAREGWVGALQDIQSKGKYPELTLRSNDEQHNQYARPILENASKEFSKFMQVLTHHGMKDLPKEAAQIIAKRFLLSEAAAIANEERGRVAQENQEIKSTAREHARYNRPPLGSTMNGVVATPPAAKPTGDRMKDAADSLLRQVGVKV